jgi:uncharacterized protein
VSRSVPSPDLPDLGAPPSGLHAAAPSASDPIPPATEADAADLVTLAEIQRDPLISTFIANADRVMEGLGYTEHGFRHANLSGRIAYNVVSRLGFGDRVANLSCLAGYLHDVGTMVAKKNHGQIGALLVYDALKDRMAMSDLALVMAAVGNHEEEGGAAASEVSAAVILADKSDVHRSRVRKSGQIDFDVHDRVNFAVEQSFLRVDSAARTVTLELTIDTAISHVMEYFEIFLHRMVMCRRAAERLECRFRLTINGASLL